MTNESKRNSHKFKATFFAHEWKISQYTVNCEEKNNVLHQKVKRAQKQEALFVKALLYACVSTHHDNCDNTFSIQSENMRADNKSCSE